MKRLLLITGVLLFAPLLMGADLAVERRGTLIQQEMAELLGINLGMQLLPKEQTKSGEEFSFVVTTQVMRNLRTLKKTDTPIQIPSESELATKKGQVLQELGFIPRKSVVNEQDPFLYDVTDVTLENMERKLITIMSDGSVKFRVLP